MTMRRTSVQIEEADLAEINRLVHDSGGRYSSLSHFVRVAIRAQIRVEHERSAQAETDGGEG